MGERSDEMRRYGASGDEIQRSESLSNRGPHGTPRQEPAQVDPNADTDEIREDIEHTRADMGETIDAIQERLNPDRLKSEARDTVREQSDHFKAEAREQTIGRAEHAMHEAGDTAKGAGERVMETIRNNPVPAALAGIGLGWLFMRGRSSSNVRNIEHLGGSRSGRRQPDYGYAQSRGRHSNMGESAGQMGERASQYGEQAQMKAGEYSEQAQNLAGEYSEQAQQYAGQAQERMGQMTNQAQHQAQRLEDQVSQMMRENPLALSVIAFGIGSAVGMLVPETNKESEIMGDARDSLVDMAQETAQEKVDQAKKVANVANEAQRAARNEADDQGLTES